MQTERFECWDGKTTMAWVYDDGGRADAGFKGLAGDCVTRSIAIVTQRPYNEVYDQINDLGKGERANKQRKRSSSRTGVRNDTSRQYLASIGWIWHPTMHIGSGCKVHLCEEELPMGRLLVAVSRHLTAVIDRVIYDVSDPQRNSVVTDPRSGGVPYIARRCVYGYFTQP